MDYVESSVAEVLVRFSFGAPNTFSFMLGQAMRSTAAIQVWLGRVAQGFDLKLTQP